MRHNQSSDLHIFYRNICTQTTLSASLMLCVLMGSLRPDVASADQGKQGAVTKATAQISATDFLKSRIVNVLELAGKPIPSAKEKSEIDSQLLKLIIPMIDFALMSEKSLGKHWSSLNQPQKDTFVQLFKDLVFYSYIKKIRSVKTGDQVSYESEEKTARGATVEAVAQTKNAEYEMRFHLRREEREGGLFYIAEDIDIDEVSLVQNYREQFNKIILDEGFDGLIKKMEAQVAKVK